MAQKSLVLFKVGSSSLCGFLRSVSSSSPANDISQGFFWCSWKTNLLIFKYVRGKSHLKYPVCAVVFTEALLPLKTDGHFIAVRTRGSICRLARLPLVWESVAFRFCLWYPGPSAILYSIETPAAEDEFWPSVEAEWQADFLESSLTRILPMTAFPSLSCISCNSITKGFSWFLFCILEKKKK